MFARKALKIFTNTNELPVCSYQAIKGFANLLPLSCTAIRDGREQITSVESLVVGDIIVIKSGERVPADARILVSRFVKNLPSIW